MKKFLLVRKQRSDGCDYSIGCGKTVSIFQAESLEAAKDKIARIDGINDGSLKKAAKEDKDPCYYLDMLILETALSDVQDDRDSRVCDEIDLYEISAHVDMIPLLKKSLHQVKAIQREIIAEQNEARDLAEFERLKKKLGK